MPQGLTLNQFAAMFPKAAAAYFAIPLNAACEEFEITTPDRQAAFFAQLDHESVGLTRLEESFAYSSSRLRVVWPFRFRTTVKAQTYANRGPRAIASYVYADRMGNGAEKTEDGWTYRGRGFIQLTGWNNYSEFGKALGLDLVNSPDQAAEPAVAARIAARYWKTRGCNELADAGNFVAITRAINGGLTGLKERTATWKRFQTILAEQVAA